VFSIRQGWLCIALLSACFGPARAQWVAEASGGYVYDSNISRAALASDVKSDAALEASIVAGRWLDLSDNLGLTLTGELASQRYQRYGGLDNTTLAANADLKYKFGLGRDVPWIRGSARLARLDFKDRLRDGWRSDVGMTIGKRVFDRWEMRAGLSFDRRIADIEVRDVPAFSGSVFDVKGKTVSASLSYTPDDRWQLAAGVAFRSGDITSTGVHTQAILNASTAWTDDDALGDDAYRIGAKTTMLNIGASYALGERTSLNLGIDRWISHAVGGFDYSNTIGRASLIHSFF
jgi:long-subunit fatty acid transport protein